MKFATWLAALTASAAAALCHADGLFAFEPAGCGAIQTVNQTPKWAWITIYDAGQTRHLDYGWVGPFTSRQWRAGQYSCAGVYHVRGELKDAGGSNPPGDIPNIFDTRVEVSFGNNHDVYLQTPIALALYDAPPFRWAYAGPPWKFWWSHSSAPPAALQTGELPKIMTTNLSELPALITVTSPGDNASMCFNAGGGHDTLRLAVGGPHEVKWTIGCDPQGPSLSRTITLGYSQITLSASPFFTTSGSATPGNTALRLNNSSTLAIGVSVAGSPQQCAAPKGNVTVSVKPGPNAVAMTIKRSCGDMSGVALPVTEPNFSSGTTLNYNFVPNLL